MVDKILIFNARVFVFVFGGCKKTDNETHKQLFEPFLYFRFWGCLQKRPVYKHTPPHQINVSFSVFHEQHPEVLHLGVNFLYY